MAKNHSVEPTRNLRLWPGVLIVALQWLIRFVVPVVDPGAVALAVVGGLVGGLATLVWWVFLSRAPWSERLGAPVLMALGLFATSFLVHESIAGGMMGMMLVIFAVPVLSLGLVAWAVGSQGWPRGARRLAMVAATVLACGVFPLLRTGGITGDADSDFHWRWTPSPEERLLARPGDETARRRAVPTASIAAPDWPGFRGSGRDAIVGGARIETDWKRWPPAQLWRRPIGPGWSSFAVSANLLYTQEQRGPDEIVSCYDLASGNPVWLHHDAARFWESNAGPGPRATPTVSKGHVYTLGATGILNALDARDGSVVWARNAAADTGVEIPGWGFASSPLVYGDMVITATGGRLVAYDRATGELLWLGPAGGGGYSSPHLATIHGVAQVLLLNGTGIVSVTPSSGRPLWQHAWRGDGIVQPGLTPDGDVLIGTGSGMGSGAGTGVRRIEISREPGGWSSEELWTTSGLKPYFNDFVIHRGHAFGFDGSILACIDLADGKRRWKGGRYGHGQLILLPEQDVLLVLSESGELALVAAATDRFRELARFKALEGKTWNHPVLIGDVLVARNGQEMASFRLSVKSL